MANTGKSTQVPGLSQPANPTGTTNPTVMVTPLSSAQFASLLSAIENSEKRLDNKLAAFKSEIKDTQDEAASKVASRVRNEQPYAFKRKGNEEQAKFNGQQQEVLLDAEQALAGTTSSIAVDLAMEAVRKGTCLLTERQKLIKIADRSEHSWGVIAEYTADERADDSNDERRLEKAEKAAEKKVGKRKRKRMEMLPRSLQRPTRLPGPSLLVPLAGSSAAPGPLGLSAPRRFANQQMRPLGLCFACGKMGHLRVSCPRALQGAERKSYPLLSENGSAEWSIFSHGACASQFDVEMPVDVSACDMALCSGAEWEREVSSGQLPKVKGRLREHVSFWKEELHAPPPTLLLLSQVMSSH